MKWLFLEDISQMYVENQEQMIQQNNFKSFEFGRKQSSSKSVPCNGEKENLAVEKISNKKYVYQKKMLKKVAWGSHRGQQGSTFITSKLQRERIYFVKRSP